MKATEMKCSYCHEEFCIDEFVRDVCSVVPKSKSEVRERLEEILSHIRKEATEQTREKMHHEYEPELTARQEFGREQERARVKMQIGFLRQWLNERNQSVLVSNKDIEAWLLLEGGEK